MCRCRRAARPSSCCPATARPLPASSTQMCRPAMPSSRSSTLCCPQQPPAALLPLPQLLQQAAGRPHHPHSKQTSAVRFSDLLLLLSACGSRQPEDSIASDQQEENGSGSAVLSAQQLLMLRCLGPLLTGRAVVSACRWMYSRHMTAMSGVRPSNRKREAKTITIDTEQNVGNRLSACKSY